MAKGQAAKGASTEGPAANEASERVEATARSGAGLAAPGARRGAARDVERFRSVGRFRIDPPLGRAEFEYLAAFAESRRWRRTDGPYVVPDNPLAECLDPALDLARYSEPADGQPGLWCPWAPGDTGRALVPVADVAGGNGLPPEETAHWLSYLCDHFLRPGALAQRSGEARQRWFTGFTFDHVLDGAAAVSGEWSGELTVIKVVRNSLSTEVLAP
ncbi:hypothetical protein [Actinopolymorpha pittospori]|uniref:Uncharacterized protein n=1 Tax=Actinopolymorpha pittospori TaxID=648752 RepID=A0A927MZJ2_9ACTN|nr:hypothetical protein [Actinopolymorpha pittospori]MBE1609444.1 hypothetical protein [Actinopolymorpha pittospori]